MNLVQMPLVMVRENSVKTDKLKKMQASETIRLLKEYREKNKKIEEFIDVVTDEIEHYVKIYYDTMSDDCKKLIELKRNIFNKRYNKTMKYKELVDRHPLLTSTKFCLDEIIQLMEIKVLIKKNLEEECDKSRTVLWNIWKEEADMKCSLLHFDENLSMKLGKYLEKNPKQHNMKLKKLDGTLLKLYTRAALKPSPFSTLCKVKMLMGDRENENNIECHPEKKIQINYVHIFRLWEYVSRVPEVAEQLNYKVNYSIRKEEKGYSVSKMTDVPDENGKIYNGRTMLFRMPESEMMDRLYALRGRGQCTYSYEELRKKMGMGKEFPEMFQMLLDKKLIYCVEKPEENSFDIIGDFLKNLKKWKVENIPCVQKLAKTLIIVQQKLKLMEQSNDWTKRSSLYEAVHHEIGELYKAYGHEKWCDKNVIYEDYIQPEIQTINRKLSDKEKKVMELFCSLNLLFDVNVRTQTEFARQFYGKYGNNKVHTSNGTLISEMIHAGQKYNYLWENNMKISKNTDNAPINICLDELKAELLTYINQKMKNGNKDVIELDRKYLEDIIKRIPQEVKRRKRSFEFFLQFADNNIVINNIYTGYSMYFSRFLQYYPKLWEMEEYRKYMNLLFNRGEKICDMRIASGFNGNIRPELSDYELILPSQSETEDASTIDYRDCYYIYDTNEQRVKLYHDKIGTFTTLSLGSLMPLYLPGITGILHSIFTNSLAFKDLNKLAETDENPVVYMPRICIENVVICRKSWMLNGNLFAELLSEDGDFTKDFCQVNEMVLRLGMPSAVFVRKNMNKQMTEVFLGNGENRKLDMTMRKPQFIDFHNPLLVKLFIHMFAGDGELIIEEAYPDYTGSDTNVREAVYEFSMVEEGVSKADESEETQDSLLCGRV